MATVAGTLLNTAGIPERRTGVLVAGGTRRIGPVGHPGQTRQPDEKAEIDFFLILDADRRFACYLTSSAEPHPHSQMTQVRGGIEPIDKVIAGNWVFFNYPLAAIKQSCLTGRFSGCRRTCSHLTAVMAVQAEFYRRRVSRGNCSRTPR